MNWLIIDEIIKNSLLEDAPYGDITTNSIVDEEKNCTAQLIAKETGIIAGVEVFKRVFSIIGAAEAHLTVKDGDLIEKGQVIGEVKGNARKVLTGERIALNILQRMSGVATITNKFVQEIKGTKAKLLDTRKTTPGIRILEKYAVIVGGGCNHRANLSDGVLIKDNHIKAAGGIISAITMVKNNVSFVRKIEVEVESLEELNEALDAKADIIMLDNMDTETMKKAVSIINGRAIIEASGNVSLKTIGEVAKTGVDYISVGILTHSYSSLDLSLKNLKLI